MPHDTKFVRSCDGYVIGEIRVVSAAGINSQCAPDDKETDVANGGAMTCCNETGRNGYGKDLKQKVSVTLFTILRGDESSRFTMFN